MEKKQARRVRKSKDSLKNSLIELMQSKSVNNITVKELVIKADLNRSTFYNYYCDIPDMLKKLEEELYTEFLYTIERHIYKCDKNIDIWNKKCHNMANYLNERKLNNELFMDRYNYLSYKKLLKKK